MFKNILHSLSIIKKKIKKKKNRFTAMKRFEMVYFQVLSLALLEVKSVTDLCNSCIIFECLHMYVDT